MLRNGILSHHKNLTQPIGVIYLPTWLCLLTHVALFTHPRGFVYSPRWLYLLTHLALSTHPRGFVYSPTWLCLFTHVALFTHPRGFVYSPTWIARMGSEPVMEMCAVPSPFTVTDWPVQPELVAQPCKHNVHIMLNSQRPC
jgi:hypothetical protein